MNDEVSFETAESILYKYNGNDKIVLSTEIAERLSAFDDMASCRYSFGIPSLDKLIEGVQLGELTILSGPTGTGKTLLAQSLTRNFHKQNIISLWFTYEVPTWQFLRQFGTELPVFCLPQALTDNSLDWLEKRIYESYLKFESKVVFIDHLHYLIDMQSKQNISLEIGFLMRSLKKLAIKYAQCIFLIAHMSKIKEEKEPDTEHLRDSGMIGCEADNVFFIWRKKSNLQESVLKISKNRRCGQMGKKIDLIKIGAYLEEKSNRRDEEEDEDD